MEFGAHEIASQFSDLDFLFLLVFVNYTVIGSFVEKFLLTYSKRSILEKKRQIFAGE